MLSIVIFEPAINQSLAEITYQDDTTPPNFDPGNVFTVNTLFKASRSGNYKFKTRLYCREDME